MADLNFYSEATSTRLLRVLAAAGRIPDDLQELEDKGWTAVDYLDDQLAQGRVDDDTLCTMLGKGYSLPRAQVQVAALDLAVTALLPWAMVQDHKVFPYEVDGRLLKLAMLDPEAMNHATAIQEACGFIPEFYLISLQVYGEFMARLQSLGASTPAPSGAFTHTVSSADAPPVWGAAPAPAATAALPESAPIPAPAPQKPTVPNEPAAEPVAVASGNVSPSPVPVKAEPPATARPVSRSRRAVRTKWPIYDPELVVEFCDQILYQAVHEKVSDIHIECFRESARVRMRLDGALQIMSVYSDYLFKNYQAVTTRFKILAGCDISEKRLAQDGAITITDDGRDIDFRFNTVPTKNGERIVMRILAGDAALSLDKIGFDPEDYKKVIDAITAPQGMVLVTGPTGSGKTTTLYGALQHINAPDINILTAEDPIEYYLDGAGQVQANEKIGLTFSSILRAFLRQDPEVILVGEIRDQETIDIAVKAALTGHLLLSTLHTNDAISSITRMLNMGVPNFMISSALSLIVAQRLARKNCPNCRAPDPKATPEVLRRIGFAEEEIATVRPLYGVGCPSCNGNGLKGRRGIYEVLRKTKHIEEAILANEQAPQLLAAARHDGFKTMQEIGRELIASGDISVDEFMRTLVSE